MKEIRTIKMVEVTDIKFVADDGTEFIGMNAESDCMAYERTRDMQKVKKEYERIYVKELKMPFIDWFCDESALYQVQLDSRRDFFAMMDYYNVVWNVCGNYIAEPTEYPYTMLVSYSYDTVTEYTRDIKAELKEALEQFN